MSIAVNGKNENARNPSAATHHHRILIESFTKIDAMPTTALRVSRVTT
jgi:hypothetical protein